MDGRGLRSLIDRDRRRRVRELAGSIRGRSTIKDTEAAWYTKSGKSVAEQMTGLLTEHLGSLKGAHVLDFGAGAGRVGLPFARRNRRTSLTCVDVDAESVELIRLEAPKNCAAIVGPYTPPVEFSDETFDAMWAVSVWSHFPEQLGLDWLREMKRICRPGAVLVVSYGNTRTLAYWQETTKHFQDVTEDDLQKRQFIYEEFETQKAAHAFPGIAGSGSWGNTLIDPSYIEERWGQYFEIVGYDRLPGTQDLVVMKA